jgi:VCBS repeat-containing protein
MNGLSRHLAAPIFAAMIYAVLAGGCGAATVTVKNPQTLKTGSNPDSTPTPTPTPTATANPTAGSASTLSTNEDTAATYSLVMTSRSSQLSCNSATVSYTSSNINLVAAENAIAVSGTWPNCVATITPTANASGSSTLTFTVASDARETPQTIEFNVAAVNDAPTISNIVNQSTTEDTPLTAVAVTISDADSTLACDTAFSFNSSNTTLLPVTNIVASGTAPNCLLTLTPASNLNGSAVVTATVSDGTRSAQDTFTLAVSAANDAPTISDVANQTTPQNTALTGVAVTISDADNTLLCSISLTASSSNETLLPTDNIIVSGTAPNCLLSITPATAQTGSTTVTLTVSDGTVTAVDTFTLLVN